MTLQGSLALWDGPGFPLRPLPRSVARSERSYQRWLEKVDEVLAEKLMLTHEDLDVKKDLHEMFADGDKPSQAAIRLICILLRDNPEALIPCPDAPRKAH